MHDFINAPGWHLEMLGQPILGHLQGLQKIVEEDLAGMNG
jgi:hypothetical protein